MIVIDDKTNMAIIILLFLKILEGVAIDIYYLDHIFHWLRKGLNFELHTWDVAHKQPFADVLQSVFKILAILPGKQMC